MTPTVTLDRQHIALRAETYLSRDVRVGVVGCGYWGPKLARVFSTLPGATLAKVADLREERLADIRQRYPEVVTTHHFQDLLGDDIDAVVVATPVRTHYRLAKAALLAGKHVLVEKPLALRADEGRELTELAAERGLTLMVGHTFVYNPAVEAVREIVQSGELGRIYYLNATRVNLGLLQPDINVMWDLGPHDISLIRFILGADPLRVSAHGSTYVNTASGLHEIVYMSMFFADGVMANLRFSWLHPVKQRRLTVVGSKKMLVYDDIASDKVVLYDKGVEVLPYSVTEEEFHASYRHGERTVYPLEWVEPLQVECTYFLESIRTGAATRSGGEDGIRVIKVLETAQRSLMNGGVELKIEY
ncbi:MAG TPA: Gfo/Idh/MocA family oxidoreductase [Roseiflexaceae bacterium]|nr:Gfo/Idh/MocA family oxidoreductase [Roseiflexaceae bacterium]